MADDRITNGEIAFAIISNILWTAAFTYVALLPPPHPFTALTEVLPLPIYAKVPLFMVVYPIFGKFFCELVHAMFNAVDVVYEIKQQNQWGNWDKGSKLAFASWWPVTAPIGLVIGSIALVYGILFKGLFN